MKYTLAILCIIILIKTAYSQTASIGIKAGLIVFDAPFSTNDKFSKALAKAGFLSGIKIAIDSGHFQCGTGLDFYRYKYNHSIVAYNTKESFTSPAYIPLNYPNIFFNYKFALQRSYILAGFNAGPAFMGNTLTLIGPTNTNSTSHRLTGHGSGGSSGLQMGYILTLTKKWNFQMELTARYIQINYAYVQIDQNGQQYELRENTKAFATSLSFGVNNTF